MPVRSLASAPCWLLGAFAAVACAGGDGGGQPHQGSRGPWLPYAGGGVFAVDLAAPASPPFLLDSSSGVGGLRAVEQGTYDAATGTVSGWQPHTAVWTSGGKIWRASAIANGGPAVAGSTPVVAQVSSESSVGDPSPLSPTATHLCDTAVVADWAVPTFSYYLYTLAGSDRQCGGADDVVKSTRLSSTPADPPVTVPGRRVGEVREPVSGTILGWLLIDGVGRLVRTDFAFANPVQIATSVGFAFVVGRAPTHLLILLQSGSQVTVRRFNPVGSTLDATALFTLPGGIASTVGARAQDDTTVYMMVYDGSTGASSLYRMPLAATQADSAVQMTSEAGHNVGTVLLLTTTKVVFTTNAAGTDSLVAVDKTAAGTAAAPLLGPAQPSGTSLTLIGAAADKVYVNAVGSGRSARAVSEDGMDAVVQANAAWVGLTQVGSSSTAVLATGLSPTGSYGGASLSTVVAATAAPGMTLGALPAELTGMDRLHWSAGKGLLRAFTGGQSTYGEILFADAGVPGSLLRVTNTASVSESLP